MDKGSQIKALLNSAGKASPEITHGLSELGDGKMSDGLIKLWKSGQYNGMVKGAAIVSLAFGAYTLITNALEEKNIKAALGKLDSAGSPTICSEVPECKEENVESEVADKNANEESEQK